MFLKEKKRDSFYKLNCFGTWVVIQGWDSPKLKLDFLCLWLALFQWKTKLVEKTVIVELGESWPWSSWSINIMSMPWKSMQSVVAHEALQALHQWCGRSVDLQLDHYSTEGTGRKIQHSVHSGSRWWIFHRRWSNWQLCCIPWSWFCSSW